MSWFNTCFFTIFIMLHVSLYLWPMESIKRSIIVTLHQTVGERSKIALDKALLYFLSCRGFISNVLLYWFFANIGLNKHPSQTICSCWNPGKKKKLDLRIWDEHLYARCLFKNHNRKNRLLILDISSAIDFWWGR